MRGRNPYLILGVAADASDAEIRRAYHHLALRHHPDRTGRPEADVFLEIREAYQLLSDATARQALDRMLPADQSAMGYSARRHSLRFSSGVIVEAPPSGFGLDRAGSSFEFDASLPGEFDLLSLGFIHEGVGHAHDRDLHFDLLLSPEEAARGGRFSFSVPLRRPCAVCRGHRRIGGCRACGGEGSVMDERGLEVYAPPGVRHGQRASLWLGEARLPGATVEVMVRIE